MKIAVKTLKGELFHLTVESTDTVLSLKEKIQSDKPDFQVDKQKLIHSGKVLKDSQTIGEIGMKETDFIVCMVSKETAVKPKSVSETPTSTLSSSNSSSVPIVTSAPRPITSATTSSTSSISTVPTALAVPTPAVSTPAIPAAVTVPTQSFATPEGIAGLTGMGFPESEVRSALEAAMGNPDLAYEFLLTGIPEQALAASRMRQGASAPPNGVPAPTSTSTNTTNITTNTITPSGTPALQQFRSHPQFEQLKQLIQSNPSSLPQVLTLIGQQNPQLLEAIHANNEEFLAMMNEPVNINPVPASTSNQPTSIPSSVGGFGGMGGTSGDGHGPNPAQIIALLSALPPEQRAAFAQQVGLSPEQLNAFMQMVATIPPDQLSQLMPSMSGAGGGAGGHVIRLTEEEHAAVTRLTQLGFSQQQAVQAYLACDKNEALAANLLFDGGFGFDDEDGGGGMGGGGYGDFGDDGGDDYN